MIAFLMRADSIGPAHETRQISFKSQDQSLPATLFDGSPVGVVLCPPHPLYGGSRHDMRIAAIAQELATHDISALCFDYGSYQRSTQAVQNVVDAMLFMRGRVASLGLLGYSFGAVVASNAAAQSKIDGFVAVSIPRNVNGLRANVDFNGVKLFVHGVRDNVASYAEFEDLYREVKGPKQKLVVDTDHFYMDDYPAGMNAVAQKIRVFFENTLGT